MLADRVRMGNTSKNGYTLVIEEHSRGFEPGLSTFKIEVNGETFLLFNFLPVIFENVTEYKLEGEHGAEREVGVYSSKDGLPIWNNIINYDINRYNSGLVRIEKDTKIYLLADYFFG